MVVFRSSRIQLSIIYVYDFFIIITMISDYQEGYYFILCPKYIQFQGTVTERKMPQFAISIFLGHTKIDQIISIPTKQQKYNHTLYWLGSQRLQFNQVKGKKKDNLIRIQVQDQRQIIGIVLLDGREYIKKCEDQKEYYYCQRVKISQNYQMEFDLFIGASRYEIQCLVAEYYGESDIKTPITKQSQERYKEEIQNNFAMAKIAQSQIYSVQVNGEENKTLFQRIQEEQSINSSIPQTGPLNGNNRFAFKIGLKQVQQRTIQKTIGHPTYTQISEINKITSFSLTQILSLSFFGVMSLVMIYFSMIPIKKI